MLKRMMVVVLSTILMVNPLGADIVKLKSLRKIKCKVLSETKDSITVLYKGKNSFIKKIKVLSVHLDSEKVPIIIKSGKISLNLQSNDDFTSLQIQSADSSGLGQSVIYLKNGKLVKGMVTEDAKDYIIIEKGDTWEKIQKSDIEKTKGVAKFTKKDKDKAYEEGYFKGRVAGRIKKKNRDSGWILGGFALGFLLGLIGTGLATAFASSGKGQDIEKYAIPKHRSKPPDYIEGYKVGYKEATKGASSGTAVLSGLAGTLVAVAVISGMQEE